MCGILCEICYSQSGHSILKDSNLVQRIKNRGPDCSNAVKVSVGDGIALTFCGAVLWTQGADLVVQPLENEHGILLYNGDIFNESWNKNDNDTKVIMKKLSNIKSASSEEHIIKQLEMLKGPFSIIYYNKYTQDLYFMRDRIGRNTLLFHRNENSVVISSVLGREYKCVEIPATNIHVLNIIKQKIILYPWDNGDKDTKLLEDWWRTIQDQQNIPDEHFKFDGNDITVDLNDKHGLIKHIQETAQEMKCKSMLMSKLLEHAILKETVLKITQLLERSITLRLEAQPQKCKNCIKTSAVCTHCTVGILFSGGLDCTILAFLADKYLYKEQSIELLNVAFNKDNQTSYDVPDRLTGKQSFEELKKLCPLRKWLFKEINIPRDELKNHQRETIGDLVYPRQTILDESLGSALWFAARGKDNETTSPCRILLLGSGADELFGGYTRHRNAFKRKGWLGLHKELSLDWQRISFRNLARDNRVICDHGRQPRMPYLDDDLVDYVLKLQPWLKCFPSDILGPGVGDKLILRLVAFNLGLTEVMTLPKRALQFGSKIANKNEKGSDISKTLTAVKIY